MAHAHKDIYVHLVLQAALLLQVYVLLVDIARQDFLLKEHARQGHLIQIQVLKI